RASKSTRPRTSGLQRLPMLPLRRRPRPARPRQLPARRPPPRLPQPPRPATAHTATPAPPTVDPVQQWSAETENLREKIRELIDREATDQLDINRISNEVYKPDTRESDRDRARTQLGNAQQRLAVTREQLATARLE